MFFHRPKFEYWGKGVLLRRFSFAAPGAQAGLSTRLSPLEETLGYIMLCHTIPCYAASGYVTPRTFSPSPPRQLGAWII